MSLLSQLPEFCSDRHGPSYQDLLFFFHTAIVFFHFVLFQNIPGSPEWPPTHHLIKDGPKLLTLLPSPPKSQEYRYTQPH